MARSSAKRLVTFLVLGSALIAGGCSSGSVVGPANQPEVTNIADSFQWQVTGLAGVTQTLTYQWSNSGTMANVNQSAAVTAGSATLRITDAAGTEVYSGDLSTNGTYQSATGVTGAWTVTVVLTNVSGTLNFRLQKP